MARPLGALPIGPFVLGHCLVAISLITGNVGLLSRAQLKIPPDGLAFRAQDIPKQLGYGEQPKSTAYGFDCCDQDYLRVLEQYDTARRNALSYPATSRDSLLVPATPGRACVRRLHHSSHDWRCHL